MAALQPSLFNWENIEVKSDIERFILVRNNMPDEKIIRYLEVMRANGRDDFPIKAMWNAVIAGIVFQHVSIASLVREFSRNPSLLQACGFDILPLQKKPDAYLARDEQTGKMMITYSEVQEPHYSVPNGYNFSRFLFNVIELEETLGLITGMQKILREQLMDVLPGFGEHQGYDGKAIESHSTGQVNKESGETSDPDANWGKHETCGFNSTTGKPWSTIKSWFGYGIHVMADTHYEIPLAIKVTPASTSEHLLLREMIHEVYEQTAELASRCKDFSADRGLDSGETKSLLWDDHQVRPLIDTRELWREEKQQPGYDPEKPITRPLFPERADTIVYTEKGNIHCICPETGEQRDMAFQGFEADRETLKYRCPASAYNLECKGREQCHKAGNCDAGDFGRIVRIDINQDRRIFTPTPHGSPTWHRGYNRRSALERINSRIDESYCFENHYIRGLAKMQTRIGLATAVMMAMALGHVKEGRQQQMRSLVKPIPIVNTG